MQDSLVSIQLEAISHGSSNMKWGLVIFDRPDQAAAVLAGAQGHILEGRPVTVKPAGLRDTAASSMMDAKLFLYWYTMMSAGSGEASATGVLP